MSTTISKSWVYTINNPTVKCYKYVKAVPCQRILAEDEICPTTGTPHLQGAIVWKNPMRRKAACAALGGRASLKVMGGTWADQEYCLKEGNIVRMEDNTQQGVRTDLIKFRAEVVRDPRKRALDMDGAMLQCVAKFPRLESRLRGELLKVSTRPFRKVDVIVHWGAAGTGKTRGPYEEGAFVFDDYADGWWDGYDGESAILFDDFYGGIKWSLLLRLLDGYQVRLKIKHGFTYANWTKVYITSNKPPSEWYARLDQEALTRRITKVIHFLPAL